MKSPKLTLVVCLLSMIGARAAAAENTGAVFAMTNAAANNRIMAYTRNADGTLTFTGAFATGGNGSGGTVDPLKSQGALSLSSDHHFLFAVNAGSNTVSSFVAQGSALTLADTVSSRGSFPNAVAQWGNLLYVLNAKGSGNVSGFRIAGNGHLISIPNSTRGLSGSATSPTSLAFSPNGQFLVVTENATNNVDVFRVLPNGTLSEVVANSVPGAMPFAAVFAPNGALLVSGTANTIYSFSVQADQTIHTITSALPTDGMATCWDFVAPNGHVVYTVNSATSNLSGFNIASNGSLSAIGSTIVGVDPAGSAPLDSGISSDGKFVYTLNAATGAIGIFSVASDGTLISAGQVSGLPASAGLDGFAAY